MQEELNQFIANDVWELVPQPRNMKIIGTKWVFRNTLDENGVVSRNKAMLVAQGYNQQEGIDYDETYALVARLESIRILLAYACALDFKLFQMDVKRAFLNDFINEEAYVAQPLGFIDFEKPDHVYKINKALYGFKQAPKKSSNLIIVQIYVDDIIFGSTYQDMCDEFAKIMHDEFKMSMMGELNFFLGLQIKQMEDGIFFNQSKYIKEMLKKFGLKDSKPMKTPMYFDTKLTKDEECESVDSTKDRHETVVYADSDHAGDYVDRKSTSGIYTFVGCCLTSWFLKKQTALVISTIEAEYVSTEKACQKALWMKQALIDYSLRLDDVPIMCDNNNVIDLSKNPVQHSRTKHIEIRHHFLRDNVQKRHISIEKCRGHKDHVSAYLCHMLYCIESSTLYNLAFFILKRMEKTRNKPKELPPYGMLLSRLFKHIVKRPYELNASSSSATQNHPSSSLLLDAMIDENDDESSHPNSSSPSQQVSSSSTIVSRVRQNPSHESHNSDTFLSENIYLQTQRRDAHREGLRSIGQALKNMKGGKWR
uniref:Retrovirus-related Pol polyprotein from transposon TNT 1-94 n=1 Tax=Tanacetum cinerariifolium TaxID=118510 RepID=A0A6L2N3S1_TANCI|nr:retrovirus-related Pol polyprotein from transposon TNT 1-94 [Tanacetum cinerariifolium]